MRGFVVRRALDVTRVVAEGVNCELHTSYANEAPKQDYEDRSMLRCMTEQVLLCSAGLEPRYQSYRMHLGNTERLSIGDNA